MHPSNETSGGRSLLNETQPLEYIRRVTCINLNGGNATLAALSNEAPPSEQKSQSLISKFSTSLQLPLFTQQAQVIHTAGGKSVKVAGSHSYSM